MLDYATSRCSTRNGTFSTLQMLLSQEVDVVFGPVCSAGKTVSVPRNKQSRIQSNYKVKFTNN